MTDPTDIGFSTTVSAYIIVLEQDMNASDLVRSAARQGGSVNISVPLLLIKPACPTQLGVPVPASVSLDLAGCVGCVSLPDLSANNAAHVYINNLYLTGLEQRQVASSNGTTSSSNAGSGDGSMLSSLPLWAFQFNRSPRSVRVNLRNVTLTLPQREFRSLLAAAGSGSGGGWKLKVGLFSGYRCWSRPEPSWWTTMSCTRFQNMSTC